MTIWDPPWPSHRRPLRSKVLAVVLHSTAAETIEEALHMYRTHNVSAHYVIDQQGLCTALVDERRSAWHAGSGKLVDGKPANAYSIGVELLVPSFRDVEYTEAQLLELCSLLDGISSRHTGLRWLATHRAVDARREQPRPNGEPLRTDPWGFTAWERVHAAINRVEVVDLNADLLSNLIGLDL